MNHCRICETPYRPGVDKFCTKCGQPLETQDNLVKELAQIERAPKPYEALRFISFITIALGWLLIVAGVLCSVILYAFLENFIHDALASQSLAALAALIFVINGVSVIAAGQVCLVLLEIRDDTHTTMQMVRRFGLSMLQKRE